ncbi:hypothetical protein F5Y11DRAFT_365858 [Daldinia sp. FL1419]|nr:hypothetical protein F5Y11DRAFT_365858 [Daldinia sp. FL1419]
MYRGNRQIYTCQPENQYVGFTDPVTPPYINYSSTCPQDEVSMAISANLGMSMLSPPDTANQGDQMKEMLGSKTGTYQGMIQDFAHFRQVHDQYLNMHNRRGGDCSDFPMSQQGQQILVKQLFEAANDYTQTYEPEDSQGIKRLKRGDYADLEFELVLWPLLMSTRDAQQGQCRLPNYLYRKEPPFNTYGSFTERFHAVCDALRTSKDVVTSLFKDATFKHRLAWRPRTELNKATNRKLNSERDVQNAIGIRMAQEKGIKATKDGELIGKDGQRYGTVKKRSTTFESKVTKAKKRGRQSKSGKAEEKKTATNSSTKPAEDKGTSGRYAPMDSSRASDLSRRPLLLPTTSTYIQGPSIPAGSNIPFPMSLQGYNNERLAPTSFEWTHETGPNTGYSNTGRTGYGLGLGISQAGNGETSPYGQLQGTTDLQHLNHQVPTSFGDDQIDQTTAQELPGFSSFVSESEQLDQYQYLPRTSSTYSGPY